VLNGINGNDVICGGMGNDTIPEGADNGRLFGEVGMDTCNGSTSRAQAKSCERITGVP
jgi:Ca2+-binding RTX toxin-like protein